MQLFSDLTHLSLPTVSICICTYMRPNSLTRLLDILASQAHTNFAEIEVSIVNDGSHETGSYPNDFSRYPFKVIYTPRDRHPEDRPRVYSCKNMAIEQSNNEIVWLLDDDLIVDDHTLFIHRLYQMRFSDDGVILRAHEANARDPDPYQAPWPFTPQDWRMDKLRSWFSFAGASFHRDIWRDVGPIDEDFDGAMGFADLDWGIRAWRMGYNVTQADGFCVFIDDSETGSHRDKFLHYEGVEHRNGEKVFRSKYPPEELKHWIQ